MSKKCFTVYIIEEENYKNYKDLPPKYTINGNIFNFIF